MAANVMQLTLSFEPGLTQEFRSLRAATQAAVLRTRGGVAGIAPGVDMSPSQLARKLQGNAEDPHRSLDVDDFEKVVEELFAKGDLTPIYYLVEKFKVSPEQRRIGALAQAAALMARLEAVLTDAQATEPTPRRRGGK